MKKSNLLILLLALFIASCSSDKTSLEQASTSKEYLEFKKLIDENISHVFSKSVEKIDLDVLSQYETADELVEASVLDKNSITYKHYKNYEKIRELSDKLYDKYGLKGSEISLKMNQMKDKSYYKNLYKDRKNENH